MKKVLSILLFLTVFVASAYAEIGRTESEFLASDFQKLISQYQKTDDFCMTIRVGEDAGKLCCTKTYRISSDESIAVDEILDSSNVIEKQSFMEFFTGAPLTSTALEISWIAEATGNRVYSDEVAELVVGPAVNHGETTTVRIKGYSVKATAVVISGVATLTITITR